MKTGPKPRPPAERFLAFVEVADSGCWEWSGMVNADGYARFSVGSKADGNCQAHRWSYEFFVAAIPGGFQVDHLCRNRRCVNPDHLEAVTPLENTRRGSNAQRDKTHCPRGHPYDSENTYATPHRRVCKTCASERNRRDYLRRTERAS